MSITIIQQRVILRCGNNLVTFEWPLGSPTVTITQSERPRATRCVSPAEAHELFNALLDAGAY